MAEESTRLARVAVRPDDFPRDGRPEIALVGRSNVGKSSLLNKLLAERGLARVSKTPGRTREAHFYLREERYYVVDLPGFGYAAAPATLRAGWAELIDQYLTAREPLVLVVQLVDCRHEPQPLDLQMRAALVARGLPAAVVLTKADKLSRSAGQSSAARARRELGLGATTPLVTVSAMTGLGIPELNKLIQARVRDYDDARDGR